MAVSFQFSDLQDKTLIVTGITSGIGKALLPGFLSQGLKLILISQDLKQMKAVRDELHAEPGRISLYECDLSDSDAVNAIGNEILKKESSIDAILHNAAIDPRESYEQSDSHFWNHLFQVNLFSAVDLTRILLPQLRTSENGRVIFTGSVMETLGGSFMSAYVASKGAVSAAARSLAHELKGSQITVNCVVPGAVTVEKETVTEEVNKRVISWQSVPRRLQPNDLLGPICLLLSQAGGGITGQFIFVDGGLIHPLADPSFQNR